MDQKSLLIFVITNQLRLRQGKTKNRSPLRLFCLKVCFSAFVSQSAFLDWFSGQEKGSREDQTSTAGYTSTKENFLLPSNSFGCHCTQQRHFHIELLFTPKKWTAAAVLYVTLAPSSLLKSVRLQKVLVDYPHCVTYDKRTALLQTIVCAENTSHTANIANSLMK